MNKVLLTILASIVLFLSSISFAYWTKGEIARSETAIQNFIIQEKLNKEKLMDEIEAKVKHLSDTIMNSYNDDINFIQQASVLKQELADELKKVIEEMEGKNEESDTEQ